MARVRVDEGNGTTRINPGPQTKIRKVVKTRKLKGPSVEQTWDVINEYLSGKMPHQIAEENGWDTAVTKTFIYSWISKTRNVHETNVLIDASEIDMAGHEKGHLGRRITFAAVKACDSKINEAFAPLLSDVNDIQLTEEEVTYCYMMVSVGDWKEAMLAAGFDAGLAKGDHSGWDTALRLRHLYLQRKPNLAAFINDMQLQNLKAMNIDKEQIQVKLLSRIQLLENRNDGKLEPTLAKYYQMLGQTTGAFTEKIEVREVSVDDVVKKMIEMRKSKKMKECLSEDIKESEDGDGVWEEVWEQDGEKDEVPGEVDSREDSNESRE